MLENQVNDYTKRRNTTENEDDKTRHREFLQRQITLGYIEMVENSAEDLTLSMQSTSKLSSDDISKDNDVSETIFKMDSLDMDSKSESAPKLEEIKQPEAALPIKSDEPPSETRTGKKKRRKKSIMKKKNSQRKTSTVLEVPNVEVTEPILESKTDSGTSSLESTTSEAEQ